MNPGVKSPLYVRAKLLGEPARYAGGSGLAYELKLPAELTQHGEPRQALVRPDNLFGHVAVERITLHPSAVAHALKCDAEFLSKLLVRDGVHGTERSSGAARPQA